MRMLTTAVAALAAVALSGSAASARQSHGEAADAAHAADMAYQTFAGGCAPNLSKPEVMQLVMADIGLKAAPDRVLDQLPHEADDHVWVLQHEGVGVAAVWSPDGARCRVLMQRGDLDKLKQAFATLLTDTAKPGLAVDKVKDDKAASPDGPTETLAYEVYATPKHPGGDDRLYTLTLSRADAPKVAAIIESTRLSGGPKG